MAKPTADDGPTALIRRDELHALLEASRELPGAPHAHTVRRGAARAAEATVAREPSALRGLVWVALAVMLVRWIALRIL